MIITQDRLGAAQSDRDVNYYQRKYAQIDREIDHVVYELYGLDSNEIETIERTKVRELKHKMKHDKNS